MIINQVDIKNFRALKAITFNMSSFSCAIGENNSGKSSLMQALKFFLKPVKLDESDYYDKNQPVIIAATMSVSDDDLKAIIDEEHRRRMSEVMRDGILKLTQTFPPNDKPRMTCTRTVLKDDKEGVRLLKF